MKYIILFIALWVGFSPPLLAQLQTDIRVVRIWDKAPHNAFPDLIRLKNHFYAALREGNNHMPDKSGQVRLLRSNIYLAKIPVSQLK